MVDDFQLWFEVRIRCLRWWFIMMAYIGMVDMVNHMGIMIWWKLMVEDGASHCEWKWLLVMIIKDHPTAGDEYWLMMLDVRFCQMPKLVFQCWDGNTFHSHRLCVLIIHCHQIAMTSHDWPLIVTIVISSWLHVYHDQSMLTIIWSTLNHHWTAFHCVIHRRLQCLFVDDFVDWCCLSLSTIDVCHSPLLLAIKQD